MVKEVINALKYVILQNTKYKIMINTCWPTMKHETPA